ncbi:MAG TPA: molybdopterin synthase sulfur carrier subunit [Bacteroidales bacterium]|nr:molybdopterin synthase sulfur carrier subunit [Bacteroidales bacterium]
MKTTVLFFGVLGEITGKKEHEITDHKFQKINDLTEYFCNLYPLLTKHKYSVSINKTIVAENVSLSDGDEIAYLPPFAGG